MTGTEHPAAEVVRNATHGDKNDWFLPSKDELNKMYNDLHLQGVGVFADDNYWSSSEYDSGTAWHLQFFNGVLVAMDKGYLLVRAVRAF